MLAIAEGLKKYMPHAAAGILTGIVTLVLVPGIMAAENWDDHDRSGRYTARDFGANYLKTLQPNGIIFTNGDNDTFPLWYNQEVEGVRTDARVCNLSYLQTDWYINQMKRQAYESEPLPFSMPEDKYRQGTRDIVYLFDNPDVKREIIDLKEAVEFIASDNPATKLRQADNAAYIPKKILRYKVDKEAVIRNNVVPPEDYDKIVDEIIIDLSGKNFLPKDEMMILDMLAHNNWERPIYWAITVGSDKYMNLEEYFRVEGFAYRFVPVKSEKPEDQMSFGTVATDIMYDNLMNKFAYGNMNHPDVYLDENNMRMMTNIRNSFNRLAKGLIEEGKKDSAIVVIDHSFELIPPEQVHWEYFAMELAARYYDAGATEKGKEAMQNAFNEFNDELDYFFSLQPKFINEQSVNEAIQRNMFYMQKIEQTARNNGDTEFAQQVAEAVQVHLNKMESI